MPVRVANGPVSWGVDFADQPGIPPWNKVYDEMAEAGYRWCELGPLGYLPDDTDRVRAELASRNLGIAGSYVFQPFHDPDRHAEVADITRTTCRRIADLGGNFLVVINLISDERNATAGRSDAAPRLTGHAYDGILAGTRAIAAIAVEHGLTPVLHPHSGTYVEFEDEIEQLLADVADDGLQLCLDTGHVAYAGIDPVEMFARHRDRVPYLHFKDIDPAVHQRVLHDEVAFFDAVAMGVFCPLGQGVVDFEALARELDDGVDRPGTVEQDVDPRQPSTPLEDARASLTYLEGLGLTAG